MSITQPRTALFLPNLAGGGAERSLLNLADGLARVGHPVDLVLARAEGAYLSQIPSGVRLVDLRVRRTMTSLPALIRYLRRERPVALLSALDHANIIALWARRLAGIPLRTVISARNTLSVEADAAPNWRKKLEPILARHSYHWADSIVAVSGGVADDLARTLSLPRSRVQVIYNPVVSDELLARAELPSDHPWLAPGGPPVVLSVGRLSPQKDYETLLRAFAKVRAHSPARLMILGDGKERAMLEVLAQELGISDDVALPGFVDNPFAYMSKASLFVLSSKFEGLPGVLIQALACGCPVVSTDCPSGPREILQGGKYGPLVPVGDVDALAEAIGQALQSQECHGRQSPPPESWQTFRTDVATAEYRKVLFPNIDVSS